jgi:MutS domain V
LVVVAGVFLTWWNYWLLPIPVAAFVVLLVLHERIERRAALEARAIRFYERGLARLDGKWAGSGEPGTRFLDPNHPYAGDLDIFGQGSVFQLICSARTTAGEDTLASWLQAPADDVTAVRDRQAAVDELRPMLDLREDLALLGEDVRSGLHAEALRRWGSAPPVQIPRYARIAVVVLSVATTLSIVGYFLQLLPLTPFLLGVLLEIALLMHLGPKLTQIFSGVELPAGDLRLLAEVLERFERERFQTSLLAGLHGRLQSEGLPPSRQIARLRKLVEYHDWGRNQAFAPIALVLLWHAHLGFAVERWRTVSGRRIAEWIQAVGEIEALSSVAGYGAEHPDDVWPELVAGGPLVEGLGLTHPLLQAGVRNDVILNEQMRLLVVSGSNMSGKSTLLRSVGLSVVMAWAGLPVRAAHLRVSRLKVGASMRVQDSIQDGKSRFYAEITRLRQIMDLSSGPLPLLFLLDELLSGTNSHDRRIGAQAIVRSLVEIGALGLVTTHDLALAEIAGQLAPYAANVHFEDHVEDGRISFDYRMRPGVVEKSNALELMRSVGLNV